MINDDFIGGDFKHLAIPSSCKKKGLKENSEEPTGR